MAFVRAALNLRKAYWLHVSILICRRGHYNGASLRLSEKYYATTGSQSVGASLATPGGDYYERGSLQLTQPSLGGHVPYLAKDVIVTPSGECTARLLPAGRTTTVELASRTGSGKDDLCLCACSTTIPVGQPGVIIDRQMSQHQQRSAAFFGRELCPPLHGDYELTAWDQTNTKCVSYYNLAHSSTSEICTW
jgi:hypothetical protein